MSEASTNLSSEAEHLVTLLDLGSTALLVARAPFLVGQQQKKIISKEEELFLNCLEKTDTSIYIDVYRNEVEKEMSLEEIKQAIPFLRGKQGKTLFKVV